MVFAELQSDFIANLIAAVYVAIYAELMARVNKAPATIFLTAAAVPLIPGGRLYYTMFGLVSEDDAMFVENGTAAIIIALAISLGFVFVAVVNKYVNRFLYGKRQKPVSYTHLGTAGILVYGRAFCHYSLKSALGAAVLLTRHGGIVLGEISDYHLGTVQ